MTNRQEMFDLLLTVHEQLHLLTQRAVAADERIDRVLAGQQRLEALLLARISPRDSKDSDLLSLLLVEFGMKRFTTNGVFRRAELTTQLAEALIEADFVDPRAFGLWLTNRVGVTVNGAKLTCEKDGHLKINWYRFAEWCG